MRALARLVKISTATSFAVAMAVGVRGALAADAPPARSATGPAVGVNIVDLEPDFLAPSYRSSAENALRLRMGKMALADAFHMGAQTIAIGMPGYFPANAELLRMHRNDLELWQNDPAAYWQRVDAMLYEVRRYGMQAVIKCWNDTNIFPTLTGETTRDMITSPDSKSFALFKKYWGDFLTRYKNDPAIALYDGPGELNLGADLDLVARCHKTNAGKRDEALLCANVGNYSTEEMNAFSARVAAFFKAEDPSKPLASNMALPPANAEHRRRSPEWRHIDYTSDSEDEFVKNLTEINAPFDLIDVHVYNGAKGTSLQRFGYGGNDPTSADLLQLVGQVAAHMGKRVYIGEFGDTYAPDVARQQFTKNVIAELPEANVVGADIWAYEFYLFNTYEFQRVTATSDERFANAPGSHDDLWAFVRQENEASGHSVYQPPSPDKIAPQVIVSFPISGARVQNGSVVNVLASADSGSIIRVELELDGKPYQSLTSWPFKTDLHADAGPHELAATAYDSWGNHNTDSIDVTILP